jgi:hypothetical protein
MSKFNNTQIDAITKAKRERPEFAGLKAVDVATRLELEGHEAWAGGTTATAVAEPPKPATQTAQGPTTGFGDLDAGPPPGAKPAEAPPKVELPATRQEQNPVASAPRGSQLPMVHGVVPEGSEELDASDLLIPTLMLKQDQTKGIPDGIKIESGEWFFKQAPSTHAKQRTIVVLHVGKSRSFMLPYAKAQRPDAASRVKSVTGIDISPEREKPICFSRDRTAPVKQDDIQPLARACAECQFSRWKQINGKSVMDCGESYHVLIVDCTDGTPGMPAWLYLRSSAIAPTKNFLTTMKWIAHTTVIDGKPAPFYAFTVELTQTSTKNDEGTFFLPSFGAPKPIQDAGLLAFYSGIRQSALASQDHGDMEAA